MTEEELRKYDKETFVQYFAQHLCSDYTRLDLDRIQRHVRFEALNKRSIQLLEEMRKIDTSKSLKHIKNWNALWAEYNRVQKKIDKVLGYEEPRKTRIK